MLSMFSFWMILVFCCFCNDKLAHSDIGDVDSPVRIHQLVFRKNWACKWLWSLVMHLTHIIMEVHSLKRTQHLKMDGWKISFLLGRAYFGCFNHTLSPIIMEVKTGYCWKVSIIGTGTHFFDFHDYGRNPCNSQYDSCKFSVTCYFIPGSSSTSNLHPLDVCSSYVPEGHPQKHRETPYDCQEKACDISGRYRYDIWMN